MQYLEIAKIINTHGLLGEVKVAYNYYGKNFSNWKPKQVVYLENNNSYQPLVIKNVRDHKGFLLVTFEKYEKIDSVLFMKNKSLMIANVIDENNEFMFEDLVGYQVINNDDKKNLGRIVGLLDNNHTGLWQIVSFKNEIFYVPNNQFFIVKIESDKKIVYLNLISGMFNYE